MAAEIEQKIRTAVGATVAVVADDEDEVAEEAEA